MAEITETEKVAPDMRRVKLGTLSFVVPPSPTLRYMFYIRRFVRKFQTGDVADDDIEQCYDETLHFLRRYNRDIDEDKLQESCELADLISFYSDCFGAADEEADAEEAGPPPARARRGTSGARKPKTRSRSST